MRRTRQIASQAATRQQTRGRRTATSPQNVGVVYPDQPPPAALTVVSAVVEDADPSTIVLTVSRGADQNVLPANSAFAVSAGHSITGLDWTSATTLAISVTPAFANGEAARTLAYTQPGSNPIAALDGGLLATFSGRAITNNVQPDAGTTAIRYRTFCYDLKLRQAALATLTSPELVMASRFKLVWYGLYPDGETNERASASVARAKTLNPDAVWVKYDIPYETKLATSTGFYAGDRIHGQLSLDTARYHVSTVTSATASSIRDTSQAWLPSPGWWSWVGATVRMLTGAAAGQTQIIGSNSADTINFTGSFSVAPAPGDTYRIETDAAAGKGGMWMRKANGQPTAWSLGYGAIDMQIAANGQTWKKEIWAEIKAREIVAKFGTINDDGFGIDNEQSLTDTRNGAGSPLNGADYLHTGTNVIPGNGAGAPSQARALIKQGHARCNAKLRQLAPGKIIIANTSTIGEGIDNALIGTLDGGLMENASGSGAPNWSIDGSSFALAMSRLDNILANTIGPRYAMWQVITKDAAVYKDMRFGLAAVFMRDGNAMISVRWDAPGGNGRALNWFDEWGFDPGPPTEAPPTGPIAGTKIWKREYRRGCFVLLQKDAGAPATIQLPAFRRYGLKVAGVAQDPRFGFNPLGTVALAANTYQDQTANNGQPADNLTINPGEGLLLVRKVLPA